MSQVQSLIQELNTAWLEGRYDDLHVFFDAAVVMSIPGQLEPMVGVEAMVDSYREFGESGTLHDFQLEQIKVFSFDAFYICHVDFFVDYELENGRYKEGGREVYVIKPDSNGKLLVVWRTQQSRQE